MFKKGLMARDEGIISWLLVAELYTRYHVLRDILDRPEDDPEVVWARDRLKDSKESKEILSMLNPDGSWNKSLPSFKEIPLSKEEGGGPLKPWPLLKLAELGWDISDKRIEKAAEYLLSFQTDQGYFVSGKVSSAGITAQCAVALIRVGMKGDPRVQRAMMWLLNHQCYDGGWLGAEELGGIFGIDLWADVGKVSCPFATRWALEALSELEGYKETESARKAMKFLFGRHPHPSSSTKGRRSWQADGFHDCIMSTAIPARGRCGSCLDIKGGLLTWLDIGSKLGFPGVEERTLRWGIHCLFLYRKGNGRWGEGKRSPRITLQAMRIIKRLSSIMDLQLSIDPSWRPSGWGRRKPWEENGMRWHTRNFRRLGLEEQFHRLMELLGSYGPLDVMWGREGGVALLIAGRTRCTIEPYQMGSLSSKHCLSLRILFPSGLLSEEELWAFMGEPIPLWRSQRSRISLRHPSSGVDEVRIILAKGLDQSEIRGISRIMRRLLGDEGD
jgi:hypothetical protein